MFAARRQMCLPSRFAARAAVMTKNEFCKSVFPSQGRHAEPGIFIRECKLFAMSLCVCLNRKMIALFGFHARRSASPNYRNVAPEIFRSTEFSPTARTHKRRRRRIAGAISAGRRSRGLGSSREHVNDTSSTACP